MSNQQQFEAKFLATAMGKKYLPNDEQIDVIEAELAPILVTAGAGAGKTETMASRVVALVANGLALPEQVLGLTFTRKAAAQLEQRIRSSLMELRDTGLFDPDSPQAKALETIAPHVSTYDAFAGELVREFGLYLPVEPSARLITDAERFAITHEVVTNYAGAIPGSTNVATVVKTVQALADSMANVMADPEVIETEAKEFAAAVEELPPLRKNTPYPKDLLKMLDTQAKRIEYLKLVKIVEEKQQELGVITYGQQMWNAAKLASTCSKVGEVMRSRFKVVMLDEYQDTSETQRVLLKSLFGSENGTNRGFADLSVAAVGDPMQAIYGWRGATTENLKEFQKDFLRHDENPTVKKELVTSWRNPKTVLDLANKVSDEILGTDSNRAVKRLEAKPKAEEGEAVLGYFATPEEECEFVAQRMETIYQQSISTTTPLKAAILVRRNRDSAEIARYLKARNVPYEIVGLGGLLWEPEIQDLVAIATMLVRPQNSAAALRILSGPLCGIGVADILALNKRVDTMMGIKDQRVKYIPDSDPLEHLNEQLRVIVENATTEAPEQVLGLADAVADTGEAENYTAEGYARIGALAAKLRHLRTYSLGKSVADLFVDIESTFNIRTEALSRSGAAGTVHLDKFAAIVEDFPGNGIGALLDYLELAKEQEDGLKPGEVPSADDRVLIMTVHKSKGLEFEHVSVFRANADVYQAKRDSFLTKVEMLPREDDGIEPESELDKKGQEKPVTRTSFLNAAQEVQEKYKQENEEEAARLFYVAMTRTEISLSVTGGGLPDPGSNRGAKKGPYEYLELLKDNYPDLVRVWAEIGHENQEEVQAGTAAAAHSVDEVETGVFPQLHPHASAVEGAGLVRFAMQQLPELSSGEEFSLWEHDATALIEEHRALQTPVVDVTLPYELTASDMVALSKDPAEFASRRRRPVPFKPNAYAKRGTAFHLWLEQRFGAPTLLDDNELPGSGEEKVKDLERLKAKFLESPWATRTPFAVEAPFVYSIGGNLVTGRMDAVFKEDDGSWFIVDWKTGRPPKGQAMQQAAMQLAVYREGWRRFIADGKPVRAAFHYIGDNLTFEPRTLATVEEMHASLNKAITTD
ncbi:MAG: UvrD-helicase domain-containing protein [Corynebacterium sp.]|nr:UvrD-helicase domain-containing protein [Corynebacterium sp.]